MLDCLAAGSGGPRALPGTEGSTRAGPVPLSPTPPASEGQLATSPKPALGPRETRARDVVQALPHPTPAARPPAVGQGGGEGGGWAVGG